MKRVFVSYAAIDSDAALLITQQLRNLGVDVFFDYERIMSTGRFTRRIANEIRKRDCLLLIQSPEALTSQQVQAEIRHAQDSNIEIIPLNLKPLNIRDTNEFAYLLHTKPVEFQIHEHEDESYLETTLKELQKRLTGLTSNRMITTDTAGSLYEIATLTGHTSWVRTVAFSPDGRYLASCSNDNTVKVWDVSSDDLVRTPPKELTTVGAHDASMWSVVFSADGRYLASCSNDNMVRVWALETLPELYEFTRFSDHHDPVYDLAFSPDGRLLGSASHDSTVHLRDISRIDTTGRAEAIVPLMHTSHVYSLSFSPDSDMLASASRDSTIRLWPIIPGEDLRKQDWSKPEVLIGHTSWVNTVTFSPVGAVLASTSHDTTIRLWDTITKECIATMIGHKEAVNTVAFSPNGRLLASSSKDNTVKVWDIATQRELVSVRGHSRWVNCAVFSPDGSLLVTASGDKTVKIWGVRQDAAVTS